MASEAKEEQNSKPNVSEDDERDQDGLQESDNSAKEVTENMKNVSKADVRKEQSDDEDDDEEEVGLLDRPVEVTGCRARKKVERLEIAFSAPKEKQIVLAGKGKKLGECPRIELQIQKIKVADLKPLHKILFNRAGSANEIKKNIRKFSGFPFEIDSAEYVRKKSSVEKMTNSILKQACVILDLAIGGTKEEIVNRILSFLNMPEDSGKAVPVPSKKKPAKKSTVKTEKKEKTEKKAKSGKKVVKKSKKGKAEKDETMEDEQENIDKEDDSCEATSMGGTDEELEADNDEPKPLKEKKAKPKAYVGKNEEKPKAVKRKLEDDSSEESDEEIKSKKANKMPTDEDITKLVRQILEAADLQEITMKKVIKQVSDAYPDFDLTHKKPFIKTTIKSIIKYM